MRQGTDLDSRSGGGGGMKGKEGSETSETVLSIDVHRTRTTDSFTTGSVNSEVRSSRRTDERRALDRRP